MNIKGVIVVTVKHYDYEGVVEWESKFQDKRNGFREAGAAAEAIEREVHKTQKSKDYGLCSTCTHFFLIESNDTTIYTSCCDVFTNFKPNRMYPVTKCSNYWHVAWLAYPELKNMAWTLQVKKGKVGFIKPKPKKKEDDDDL
jgi:hypothetical protein